MKTNKRLRTSLSRFSTKKQNQEEILSGELGIPQNGTKIVEVPNRTGYVYARLLTNKNELIQALNTSVPAIYNLPVKIRRVKNTYTIIGKEYTRYSNQGSGVVGGVIPLPRHGGQHSLNPDLNMGSDPVWVYSRQIMHMLAYPSGTTSMMLGLSPGFYQYNNQWFYPQVTGVPSFTPYVPTVTGAARMALYYLDGADNGLKISAGSLFSGGIVDPQILAAYIPTPPTSSIPLMAVKLETGTTSLDWSNLYDTRPWLQILPTGTGGTTLNIQDEGIGLGTATTLNFVGTPISVTVSGTVARIFVTGSAGGTNPPVTGSVVIWDDGIIQGSALQLNFGSNISATISGSTAQIDVTPVAPIQVNGFLAQDEGVILGTGTTLNFVGAGVTATISGSVVDVNIPGGGSSNVPVTGSMVIWDEGILLGSAATLNFVGDGIVASISGTTAQILVTGSAAGGRTLISSVRPSGTSNVSFTSIPQNYGKLTIEFAIRSTQAANEVNGFLQFNGNTGSSNYNYSLWRTNPFGTTNGNGSNYLFADTSIPAATATANYYAVGKIDIIEYASNGRFKSANIQFMTYDAAFQQQISGGMNFANTGSVTQIVVGLSAGNYLNDSIIKLYGEP